MKAKITDHAIIIKVTNFSETSLIVRCLTANHGFISFLAKGLRKAQDKTQLISLFEYELNLYSPQDQGLYLFSDANLISENTIYTRPETWAAADSGIELLEHLMIPPEEYGSYYDLVKSYLAYLEKVNKNSILILWRFWIRVFKLSGVDFDPLICSHCHKEGEMAAALDQSTGSLLCKDCLDEASRANLLLLSSAARDILQRLPQIGNLLDQIKLNRALVIEINSLLSAWWESHFHEALHCRSLGVLVQFV